MNEKERYEDGLRIHPPTRGTYFKKGILFTIATIYVVFLYQYHFTAEPLVETYTEGLFELLPAFLLMIHYVGYYLPKIASYVMDVVKVQVEGGEQDEE